ncbi:hypothetical protein ACFXQA_09635 [Microbacterium sp. P07]|uniref:hypothetical protein n=1 Tax=Microbacterium sp. P07 TaxID=3366952 RepID=UPI00374583C5
MSTPDQPATPPLTRRQMREIRHTGSTPIVTAEDIARVETATAASESSPAAEKDEAPVIDEAPVTAPVVDEAPEPVETVPDADPIETVAPAEPVEERVAPTSFADPGVAPLTRRQAREHERIRTASVPIITPDTEHPSSPDDATPVETGAESRSADDGVIAEVPGLTRRPAADTAAPAAVVNPHFGSGLLSGETPVVDLPPSFDQLITRTGSTGVSTSTPNALILSQAPSVAPLVAPVTATGEVLITGSFDLPEGLGSVGHAPGLHDGKDADAVLIDGELPAASSPTPIAASAAISQVRNNDEIIRPPAPDKGNRLVLILGITAGVLGVGVIAIFTLVFTTGVL